MMRFDPDAGTAYQHQIRQDRATTEAGANLFGAYWENLDISIKNAEVREIDFSTCERVILDYEWLGCMPAVVWHMYGIFFDGVCGGVVCYGPEYSENLGKITRESGKKGADWSKYGYEGKMILLSRGACVHWAHPHAGSKLIRASMRLLPEKYEVITCTTDQSAGEIGTIYQACGFYYVGSMRENNPNVKSSYMDRDGWLINGKIWTARSIRSQVGSTQIEEIHKVFPSAVKIKQHSKHRYFAFRGSKSVQKQHRAAIAGIIKPYPKRSPETESPTQKPLPDKTVT